MILIKLGGSLITDKKKRDVSRPGRIRTLAHDIKTLHDRGVPMLVGHGSGSFGHSAAKIGKINQGPLQPESFIHVTRTQERAAALHASVRQSLLAAGVPVFSIAPSSCGMASAGKLKKFYTEPIHQALRQQAVPLLYGDVIQDSEWGASICSTETALLRVARSLLRSGVMIQMAYWLGETDGVYDLNGDTIPLLDRSQALQLTRKFSGAAGPDVTGGIKLRLETVAALAGLGIPSRLMDGRPRHALLQAYDEVRTEGTLVTA